jgi:hypothetical protein
MSVGKESRYRYSAVVYRVDANGRLIEKPHLDLRPSLARVDYPDNRRIVPYDNDNWSRLAWRLLGSGKRWWIIADFSEVVDPFTHLRASEDAEIIGTVTGSNLLGEETSATLSNTKGVARGCQLRFEPIGAEDVATFTVTVNGVNHTSKVVTFSPTDFTYEIQAGDMSRVLIVRQKLPAVIAPSVRRAMFEAVDFGNTLMVLDT